MSGIFGSKKPRIPTPPPEPSPAPMPLTLEETEEAKRRAGGTRRRGRASTILAGRLMSKQGKTLLGE